VKPPRCGGDERGGFRSQESGLRYQARPGCRVVTSWMQRSVQRTLGTSPIRFIQDLRIERASHLLRTTELSLETISRKVGYKHPNTLRVLLRERTGKTTRDLRAIQRRALSSNQRQQQRLSAMRSIL
jgi:AraC-like DNA-binding protein